MINGTIKNNLIFAFLFVPVAKENINDELFRTFQKRIEIDYTGQKRERSNLPSLLLPLY